MEGILEEINECQEVMEEQQARMKLIREKVIEFQRNQSAMANLLETTDDASDAESSTKLAEAKRRIHELSAENRKLKEELDMQKKAQEMRDKAVNEEGIQTWVSEELRLSVNRKLAERSLEQLILHKTQMMSQLRNLSAMDSDTPNHIKQIADLCADLNLRNAQIAESKKKILDSDQEDKAGTRWNASMESTVDAKYALKALFEITASMKMELFAVNRKYDKLKGQIENLQHRLPVLPCGENSEEEAGLQAEPEGPTDTDEETVLSKCRCRKSNCSTLSCTCKKIGVLCTHNCGCNSTRCFNRQHHETAYCKSVRCRCRRSNCAIRSCSCKHNEVACTQHCLCDASSCFNRQHDDECERLRMRVSQLELQERERANKHGGEAACLQAEERMPEDNPQNPSIQKETVLSKCRCRESNCITLSCTCKKKGVLCTPNCGCNSTRCFNRQHHVQVGPLEAEGRERVTMNAIKKRLQTLKVEKDLAMDKADTCDLQSKDAGRREERLRDEVRDLVKKLAQMEHDYEVSKTQLEKSNRDLERTEKAFTAAGTELAVLNRKMQLCVANNEKSQERRMIAETKLTQAWESGDDAKRICKVLENRSKLDEERMDQLTTQLKDARLIAEDADTKSDEISRKLTFVEDELEAAEERVKSSEAKIIEREDELFIVGNILKSLEVSEEKANQRVDEFKTQLKELKVKLKGAEKRAITAEKTVKAFLKELDEREDNLFKQKEQYKYICDDMDSTFAELTGF